MHYHCEIVMPPTKDIKGQISQILAPFDENMDADNENFSGHPFWDFWVIGGRWAGSKIEAALGEERIKAFRKELTDRNVTMSSLQFGKHELKPASQIPMVDALWREWFPESGIDVCPLFRHSNDQHNSDDTLPDDITTVDKLPKGLAAERVIIATPQYEEEICAEYMISKDMWNGVNHVDSTWDGKVQTAIDQHHDKIKNRKDEWRERNTVKPDWLVVTVDYHS